MQNGIWNGQPGDAGDGNPLWDGSPYSGATGATGATGSPGVVQSLVPGANITVDNTDPAHPVIASTGGGGILSGIADNAIIRADGSAGAVQGSSVKIDDNGKLYMGATIPTSLSAFDPAITIDTSALGLAQGTPALKIVGDQNAERIEFFSNSDITLKGLRYSGAYNSQSPIMGAGLRLFGIVGAGCTSPGAITNCGAVLIQSAGTFTPTSAPTEVVFRTTAANSLAWADRWRISSEGNLEPINGGLIIPVKTLASSSAAGTAGEICISGGNLCYCIGTNSWLKLTGTTF